MPTTYPGAERARYTGRLVVMEEPEIIERIAELAVNRGHSVAAEVRNALRYWLDAWADAANA